MDPNVKSKDETEQTRDVLEHKEQTDTGHSQPDLNREDEKITAEDEPKEKAIEASIKDGEADQNIQLSDAAPASVPKENIKEAENELSSDEEHALLDRNEVVEVFEKMMKDSMQKVIDSSYSDTSNDSAIQDEVEQLDKIIHTDPQKLLLVNGHTSEDIEKQVEQINEEIAIEQEIKIEEELQSFSNRHSSDGESDESDKANNDSLLEEEKENSKNDNSEDSKIQNEESHEKHQKVESDQTAEREKKITVETEEGSNSLQENQKLLDENEENKDPKKHSSGKQLIKEEVDFNEKILDEEHDEPDSISSYLEELKKLLQFGKSKEKSKQIQEEHQDEEGEEEQIDSQMHEYQRENEEGPELAEYESKKKEEVYDGPYTELSNDILSYERFYPGRILGNTFTIINKTDKTVTINLSFTSEKINNEYVTSRLLEFYEISNPDDIEQPYLKYLQKEFVDAEKEFECWFIEDPYKKNLVKKVEYFLKPMDSFEFIVVLKSPIVKKAHFLMSNVLVENKTHNEKCTVYAFGSLDVPGL